MPSRTRTSLYLLALAIAVGAWLLEERRRAEERHASEVDAAVASTVRDAMDKNRRALWASARYDESGFERMGPPRPGEWLARFPELGQTFAEYENACANRRRAGRETIYLRPLGPLGPRARAAIEPIRAFVAAFFVAPTRVLDERALPESAFAKERDQFDASRILAALEPEREDDALVHAAIADRDLFIRELPNYVFGLGSLSERVGVYSLTRLAAGDGAREPVYRKRAFQLVAHELGHILSLPHCPFYRCVMNGSNSLVESDATPCHLCPVCHEKLAWNLGFDAVARERALAALFRAERIDDEARWADENAARLESRRKSAR